MPQYITRIRESLDKETVELLKVIDKKHKQPHYLLLTTKQRGYVLESQGTRTQEQKIDINAYYVFGPLQHISGELVIEMGGETLGDDQVRLSKGDIIIKSNELRGLRIASFMLNRVMVWTKQREQHRKVRTFKLIEKDAGDGNRERRNRLYRKFGMRLTFDDPVKEDVGRSAHDLQLMELNCFSDNEWDNVSVNYWFTGFRDLAEFQKRSLQLLRQNKREMTRFRRQREGFHAKMRLLRSTLSVVIHWPTVVLVALLAYTVGHQGWVQSIKTAAAALGYSL